MKYLKSYLITTLIVATALVGIYLTDIVFGASNTNANKGNLIGMWTLSQEDLLSSSIMADKTPYQHNGTIIEATFTTDRKGVANSAMLFDADSERIPIADNIVTLTGEVSACFWMNPTNAAENGHRRWLTLLNGDYSNSNNLQIGMLSDENGNYFYARYNGSVTRTNTALTKGVWQQVCWTKATGADGTQAMYINGVNQAITTGGSAPYANGTFSVIGSGYSTSSLNARGMMSDVRIYNKVLSAGKVLEIYNGIGKMKTPYGSTASTTTSILDSNSLIAHYSFSLADMQTDILINDNTPYQHNGTITVGISEGFVADHRGVAGGAYDFDGQETQINVGNDWIGINKLTISGWINVLNDRLNDGRIIDNDKFLLAFRNNTLIASSDNNNFVNSADNSILLNNWYYIIFTRNVYGKANFYIGTKDTIPVLSGNPNQTSGTPVASTENVIIGNSNIGNNTFEGIIDDLRVYNDVLSISKIMELYKFSI